MSKIAVRGYTQKASNSKCDSPKNTNEHPLRHDRVFVFDTETTIDQYYNLKIGYFQIYYEDFIQHEGLFYEPSMLDERENIVLKSYSREYGIELYDLEEFIQDVFYSEMFDLRTLCIGFNLPFDLSRIAMRVGDSRKKNRGGFTFTLSSNRFNPPIVIKKLGSSHSIKFTTTKQNKGENYFSGYFLDVQTLAEVLLQSNKISLAKACEKLNTDTQKMKNIEHGRVTKKYIDYLVTDVESTFEVYQKLIEELDLYQIDIAPTKIYSPASLGKHALKQLQ